MSQRPARPLRLLQSSWNMNLVSDKHSPSSLLAVYKPSGLPYFSTSQLTSGGDFTSPITNDTAGSGRHLFAAAVNSTPAVPPSDMSDSLLSRMTDLLPPGRGTPWVALPLIHPALTRYGTASYVNALTAQRKGTTLVASSLSEFMFLRNCHHLRLVRSVYRVVCRLPGCVAARVRATTTTQMSEEQRRKNAFKNPYIQQFLQRSSSSSGVVDGITLDSRNSEGGSVGLPRCAYPHPLLQGGFYDIKERKLLRHGTVSGYLSSYKLSRSVQAVVEQQQRLKSLFLSPTCVNTASSAHLPAIMNKSICEVCKAKTAGGNNAESHPWIEGACRMRVGLDVKLAPGSVTACEMQELHEEANNISSTLDPALSQRRGSHSVVGKSFKFDFRLVRLSESCELALYEVSTNDASDEEIKAAFAAANLTVLNDYVNDITLAEAMMEATQQLHALPQAKLSQLPMALQHVFRQGSPVELVAEPLFTTAAPSAQDMSSPLTGQVHPHSGKSRHVNSCGYRYAFLLEALMHLNNEAAYRCVAQLALGSGVECAAMHFPDPTQESNAYAVQHLLLRMQEQELTDAYRGSVAERMVFVSRGTTDECETYRCVLNSSSDNNSRLQIPQQQRVSIEWGNGPIPAAVRTEEMSELGCVYCGASGHVWSLCPEVLPLLTNERTIPRTALNINNNNNNNNNNNSNNKGDDTSALPPNMDSHLKKHTSDTMLLSTVDDVRDALQHTSTASTDTNPQAWKGEANVISIPNTAATQSFNPHAWRRNNTRPTLHQHRLRCAYCSGRHHITQCPKLSGSESDQSGQYTHAGDDLQREKLHPHTRERLFCIKCGNYGHLYTRCPSVPAGLHSALHCPLCLLPHRRIQHTATQCPRRVTPPRDYLPNGVPAAAAGGLAGDGRSKHNVVRHHGGSGVLLSDSFLLQK